MQEAQRLLATAHRNAMLARIIMGVFLAVGGLCTMLVSFMPTNYDWDSAMPDYSDATMVTLASVASGSAVFCIGAATALFWRSKVVVTLLSVPLGGVLYRFITLVPHWQV
jgi:hypothetical protein